MNKTYYVDFKNRILVMIESINIQEDSTTVEMELIGKYYGKNSEDKVNNED